MSKTVRSMVNFAHEKLRKRGKNPTLPGRFKQFGACMGTCSENCLSKN